MKADHAPTTQHSWWPRLQGLYGSLAVLLFYFACVAVFEPSFFSARNLSGVLYYTCLLLPAVLGVYVLIVIGLFDLSVGAVAAMCGVIAGKALLAGAPMAVGLGCGVMVGFGFGMLNWLLVVKLGIPALIATLISLGVARAVSLGVTEGESVAGLPTALQDGLLGTVGAVAGPFVIVSLVVLIAIEFLSRRHILFRRFYQVGTNTAAAAASGINVDGVKLAAFVLSGVGAAVVGILQSARTLSASPFLFPELALECIAAAVIGGARLSGGAGTAVGAAVGMLMIVTSRNLAVLSGVNVYWKELAVALVLLAAVLLRPRERTSVN